MSSNIPANPTYGVYISQLIRISRICDTFQSFVLRHRLLTERLINPRRACAARVTVVVLCLSVCLSVCLSEHAILAVEV